MRYYSEVLNLVVSHCRYLESRSGTSMERIEETLDKMSLPELQDWLSELQDWRVAFSIHGVTNFDKTKGADAVIGAITRAIRNKMIYDILENN